MFYCNLWSVGWVLLLLKI